MTAEIRQLTLHPSTIFLIINAQAGRLSKAITSPRTRNTSQAAASRARSTIPKSLLTSKGRFAKSEMVHYVSVPVVLNGTFDNRAPSEKNGTSKSKTHTSSCARVPGLRPRSAGSGAAHQGKTMRNGAQICALLQTRQHLEVALSGSRIWRLKFRQPNGKENRLTF